jgi:uncharacterized protein YbaA (DUF1428 family)
MTSISISTSISRDSGPPSPEEHSHVTAQRLYRRNHSHPPGIVPPVGAYPPFLRNDNDDADGMNRRCVMSFFDFFVAAVPTEKRKDYEKFAAVMDRRIKDRGALRVVESWEGDVPDGKLTSFPLAVKRAAGESVVVGFVEWPSRKLRDEVWGELQTDPLMQPDKNPMPFDGKRMIYGGFDTILDL